MIRDKLNIQNLFLIGGLAVALVAAYLEVGKISDIEAKVSELETTQLSHTHQLDDLEEESKENREFQKTLNVTLSELNATVRELRAVVEVIREDSE